MARMRARLAVRKRRAPNALYGAQYRFSSTPMPSAPIPASIAVLPPAGMPGAPAPGMPGVGIPALSPPEADARRDVDTDGRPRGLAPITTAGAAPIGACRQSKSDAERQDKSGENGFHARQNARHPCSIPGKLDSVALCSRARTRAGRSLRLTSGGARFRSTPYSRPPDTR
jgi:hypothetical protein